MKKLYLCFILALGTILTSTCHISAAENVYAPQQSNINTASSKSIDNFPQLTDQDIVNFCGLCLNKGNMFIQTGTAMLRHFVYNPDKSFTVTLYNSDLSNIMKYFKKDNYLCSDSHLEKKIQPVKETTSNHNKCPSQEPAKNLEKLLLHESFEKNYWSKVFLSPAEENAFYDNFKASICSNPKNEKEKLPLTYEQTLLMNYIQENDFDSVANSSDIKDYMNSTDKVKQKYLDIYREIKGNDENDYTANKMVIMLRELEKFNLDKYEDFAEFVFKLLRNISTRSFGLDKMYNLKSHIYSPYRLYYFFAYNWDSFSSQLKKLTGDKTTIINREEIQHINDEKAKRIVRTNSLMSGEGSVKTSKSCNRSNSHKHVIHIHEFMFEHSEQFCTLKSILKARGLLPINHLAKLVDDISVKYGIQVKSCDKISINCLLYWIYTAVNNIRIQPDKLNMNCTVKNIVLAINDGLFSLPKQNTANQ